MQTKYFALSFSSLQFTFLLRTPLDGGPGIMSAVLQIYRNQVALLSDRAEIVAGGADEARTQAQALPEAEEAVQDGDESQPQSRLAFSVRGSLQL